MSTLTRFVAEARPGQVTLIVPNDGTSIDIELQPEITLRRRCQWRGRDTVSVRIGGQVFEAEVLVTMAIPVSRKWGA